jgi:putative tricarboxylic transport membrane protein
MRIFDGDLTGFVQRPISGSLLAALFLLVIVTPTITAIRRGRNTT